VGWPSQQGDRASGESSGLARDRGAVEPGTTSRRRHPGSGRAGAVINPADFPGSKANRRRGPLATRQAVGGIVRGTRPVDKPRFGLRACPKGPVRTQVLTGQHLHQGGHRHAPSPLTSRTRATRHWTVVPSLPTEPASRLTDPGIARRPRRGSSGFAAGFVVPACPRRCTRRPGAKTLGDKAHFRWEAVGVQRPRFFAGAGRGEGKTLSPRVSGASAYNSAPPACAPRTPIEGGGQAPRTQRSGDHGQGTGPALGGRETRGRRPRLTSSRCDGPSRPHPVPQGLRRADAASQGFAGIASQGPGSPARAAGVRA